MGINEEQKRAVLNAFQAKVSSIVDDVDSSFYEAINRFISSDDYKLPFKFGVLHPIGPVLFYVEESADIGIPEATKILNHYDLYEPGSQIKGVFQAASFYDIMLLAKSLPKLEAAVKKFNENIDDQLGKVSEFFAI